MTARPLFYVLALAFVCWLVWAVRAPGGEPTPTTVSGPEPVPEPPTTTIAVERRVQGKNAAQWHKVAGRYLARTRSLAVTIRYDPEVSTAINLACVIYGNCGTLWRKARCESHLYPRAVNRGSNASGLFQFLPSTWNSTPFGRFSIYDPYANALAAGWMHQHGRSGEWSCR